MKKILISLNALFMFLTVFMVFIYRNFIGGIVMKGTCSLMFVILGIINLVYCCVKHKKCGAFPLLLTLGLIFGMAADIVLCLDFITGAAVFAVGHIFFLASYCAYSGFRAKDILFSSFMLVISVIILMLPVFNYGSTLMFIIVLCYGLIISLMVGKAIGNFIAKKGMVELLVLIGSVMFYLSDLMLLMNIFGGNIPYTDTMCCYLYWPGQALLAHTLFHYAERK